VAPAADGRGRSAVRVRQSVAAAVTADHADHAVIRAAADLPADFLPPEVEGRWYDLTTIRPGEPIPLDGAVAVPSGRFEVRDDGAVAEVYEVRL
jgi:hypothetical protein